MLVQLAPLSLQQDQGADAAIDYQYYEYNYEDEQPNTVEGLAPVSVSESELREGDVGKLQEAWEKYLRAKAEKEKATKVDESILPIYK